MPIDYFLFGLGSLDDLFLELRGNFLEVREPHGEHASTGCHGTKIGCVFEHFRLGNIGFDDLLLAFGLHTQDPAASRVEVADNVPHAIVRYGDFHCHNGFQQGWFGFQDSFLESHGACDLEGHFR